jgi:hypothetical protein
MKSVHKYQVLPYETGMGGLKLTKDGNECFCPKLMPMILTTKNALQQQQHVQFRLPCNTQCPHANVYEKEDKSLVYVTTCEGTRNEHACEDMPAAETTETTTNDSKIIKLQ